LEVTSERYPSFAVVIELVATFPLLSEIKALPAVKLLSVIVVAAPVIVGCFPSKACCKSVWSARVPVISPQAVEVIISLFSHF
jgi:chorismate mutase